MKLSQLIESFVISNDEFEDYLNRTTEQLAQELQSGKNARDAIHDLALTFASQHNKSYDAYIRMSDALTARMHTLELDGSASTDIVPAGMGGDMGATNDPEMMTDPMGDMEMSTPDADEMPSDSDMEDYAAVMSNEPEMEIEESVSTKTVSENIEKINQIVSNKQAGKIHGLTVDLFTASAIKRIYDDVNDANKATLDHLMNTKEGVVRVANIAMKVLNKAPDFFEANGKTNEAMPAVAAVAGGLARGAAAAAKHAPKIAKIARGAKTAVGVGKAIGGAAKMAYNAGKTQFNRTAESKANTIMRTSTRASFSEYNEFYKALDTAAKQGKKAGDTIEVGGKKIKLKSNPKKIDQLSDAEMDKIDALANRLNEQNK